VRWFQKLRLTLRSAFHRSRVESEMEAELAEHLEAEIEELMAGGVPAAEARRRAAATMGRMDLVREECRDSRGTAGWEQLKQDVSFGARLLAKNRTFAATALATMALGIGSTTAVFSVIDGVFIRPLPFPHAERLYAAPDLEMRGPFDVMRSNSRAADYAALFGVRAFTIAGRDWPERVKGSPVSTNFFDVLGAKPLLGRTFVKGEDRPGNLRKVVLSHAWWTRKYGARQDVVGKSLMLDEVPYEIIGVMPGGFQFPAPEASFWVPMRLDPRDVGEYWGSGGLFGIARLREGVTAEAAQSELRVWIPRIRAMFPWRMPDAWGAAPALLSLRDTLVAAAKIRSLLLLAVACLVLLIAIVNVANLMIGQTAARQRELALRASLGATPGRLARQLLTESVVLAAAGGLLGVLLAFGELSLLKHWLPPDTPRLAEVVIDARVLAFTAAISFASGLIFGILPAWRIRKRYSLADLKGGRATAGPLWVRSDAALVATEAAFATVLLVGAGLLLHSLWTVLHVDPGFQPASVITAELSPGRADAASLRKTVAAYDRVREKLLAYPGVRHAAAMNVLPLIPEASAFAAAIEDHPRPPEEPQYVLWCTAATPDHLDTLGIRLLQGRGFTSADRTDGELVMLVDRTTAQRFWPGGSPVGKRIKPVWDKDWRTIVGVVDDVKNYGFSGPPEWTNGDVYVPLTQAIGTPQTLRIAVRLAGDQDAFRTKLPRLVREACPGCAVSRIEPMQSVVAAAAQAPRSMAWLVGGFAFLALVLASAGIYGVVSHGVVRRTREIGVRIALGAGRGRVAWLVVGASLRYTLLGTAAGLFAAWAAARWISSLLFGVAAHDLASFSVPPLALAAAGVIASVIPIYRATRIDPARALREG
jgi:putative ABC transport system permease protein